jgi:NAD(P)-dependent dehydrogenase (short-subunit alcohol dehydrogenase family)
MNSAGKDNRMPTMVEKICLVTGATSGIGLATARALAQEGATLIAVGRNAKKGAEVVAQLRQATGNPAVESMTADLSVQAQVRGLAEAFAGRYPRLDVLVNNAGGFFLLRRLSADGIEMTWALDYLSVYLLTRLLLEPLKASAAARIVTVSSDVHQGVSLDFDDLEGRRSYRNFNAYGQAKLAEIMFTYELARRLAGTRVTANALHPGVVATNIWSSSAPIVRLINPLIRLVMLSPEAGAQTSLYLATSPEVAGVTGKYFDKQRTVRSSLASYDEAAAQRLWQISAEMTGL